MLEARIDDYLSGQDRVIRVIVLASFPRSGSTYLARMLSSAPSSSYWHEPLRYLYEKPFPGTVFYKTKRGNKLYFFINIFEFSNDFSLQKITL
jgi:hypothetical protein